MRRIVASTMLASLLPTAAHAAPGLGDEVYGATVSKGEVEAEIRYGRLGGGTDHGEDATKLELGYGVSDSFRLAMVGEFEKEPGQPRKADSVAIEAIYELGNLGGKQGGVDFALYGEYEIGFLGPDKLETKLLVQHHKGPWDLRLNLIAAKPLASGAPVELGYAMSADVETLGEVRLGVQAYGELGTFSRFAPHAEHFAGPVVKFEIEGLDHELGLELGYLFALGKAKDDTDGQMRMKLEMEF